MDDNLVHVTTLEAAETMRGIRNACREFMTNDQHEITAEEQRMWFEQLPENETVLPFLYQPRRKPAMGYGLIRGIVKQISEPGLSAGEIRWWVSGGLLPEYRGRGLGKDLFWELAEYVKRSTKLSCWLKVFEWNVVAVRTYKSIGFTEESIAADGQSVIITMKRGIK